MKRIIFRIGTFNMGRHPSAFMLLRAIHGLAVVCFQEASDQARLLKFLATQGPWEIIRLDSYIGQAATPMAYNPTIVTLLKTWAVKLFAGGDIGPGTGPDKGKPKWLIIAMFRHIATGRIIIVANLHLYAGQKSKLRQRIVIGIVAAALGALRAFGVIVFLCGDFNANPRSRTTAALRLSGWSCTQLEGDQLPTHGAEWSPDHIWWHCLLNRIVNRIRFLRQFVVDVQGSDHRLLVGVFSISRRRSWKRKP